MADGVVCRACRSALTTTAAARSLCSRSVPCIVSVRLLISFPADPARAFAHSCMLVVRRAAGASLLASVQRRAHARKVSHQRLSGLVASQPFAHWPLIVVPQAEPAVPVDG